MLAVINVRQKSVLDPELLRHRPLRYGQNVKTDDKRISEETRRTRCSRVSISFNNFYLILSLDIILILNVFI